MLLKPEEFMLAEYQPDAGAAPKEAAFVSEAAALKSAFSKMELLPNQPLRMSTHKVPRTLNGLVPVGRPLCAILSTADSMTAVSGKPEVVKERMDLYCRFPLSSPSWNMVFVALIVPPEVLAELAARTQPS